MTRFLSARVPAGGRRGLPAAAQWGFAACAAITMAVLLPARVGDDTYAFLDWGRDLRAGNLPRLEHRTFHSVPILAGAVVSLFGRIAPVVAGALSLLALAMIASASWQVVRRAGFGQPGPVIASVLVMTNPLLSLVALGAYINVPFAALLLWALAFELKRRSSAAWALLWVAGLVRPEGWAFLVAYGGLEWWRSGRLREPRRWLPVVLRSVGPPVLWMGLEWALFGSPFYSFTYTRPPYIPANASGSVAGLRYSLEVGLPTAVAAAAVLGITVLTGSTRRRGPATVLGMAAVALGTITVLRAASFNVPSRHLSVVVALADILAAIGAAATAGALAGNRAAWPAGLVVAAAIFGFAGPPALKLWRQHVATLRITASAGRALDRAVERIPRSAISDVRQGSVAMLGAVYDAQLVWDLHEPFGVVTDRVDPAVRLVVEPAPATYARLLRIGVTNRPRATLSPAWRLLVAGDWEVYGRISSQGAPRPPSDRRRPATAAERRAW